MVVQMIWCLGFSISYTCASHVFCILHLLHGHLVSPEKKVDENF